MELCQGDTPLSDDESQCDSDLAMDPEFSSTESDENNELCMM